MFKVQYTVRVCGRKVTCWIRPEHTLNEMQYATTFETEYAAIQYVVSLNMPWVCKIEVFAA